jgi:butyryl-CoA dehydrogenase
VPPTASLSQEPAEARAFAESVAGTLDRHARGQGDWAPGEKAAPPWPGLAAALDELGWGTLAQAGELACAGLGAVELGRRLAPPHHVDRLLSGSPMSGDLVRSLGAERAVLVRERGVVVRRPVLRSQPLASADGLDVHRVLEFGEAVATISDDTWATAAATWTAAGVGYLGGLGQGALDLTAGYVRQRRAFGTILATMAPVQQLLADAATAVRGVRLLAGRRPDAPALAYAGPAIAEACAACQQVTGAIGFTLEYPLHRYTQRARALATWNDALLDCVISPED